ILREPGGIECLGAVREPLVADHHPVVEGDDDPVVKLEVCAASPSAHLVLVHCDRAGRRPPAIGAPSGRSPATYLAQYLALGYGPAAPGLPGVPPSIHQWPDDAPASGRGLKSG